MPWGIAAAAAVGVVGSVVSGSMQSGAASDAANATADANKYAADIQKQIFEEQRNDLSPWRTAGNAALSQMVALDGLAPPTQGTTVTTPGASTTTRIPIGGAYGGLNGNNSIFGVIAQRVADRSAPGGYRTVTTPGQPTVTTMPGQTSQQQQQTAMSKFYTDPSYTFTRDQGIQALDRSAASKGRLFSGATGKALETYAGNLASEQYGNYYNRLAALSGTGQTAVNEGNQAAQNYGNNASALAQNTGQARASAYQASGQAWGNAINGITSSINKGIGNYLYGSYAGLF